MCSPSELANCFYTETFYAVSQRKRNAQRKFIDDVLLRREFFFQRYMFLYMTKTSVHLHYTSLSMLDYSFADSTQDSQL